MFAVESPDLQRLAVGAKAYPKVLRSVTRRQLVAVAKPAADAAKAKILAMPVAGGKSQHLRGDIAKAIKVSAGVNTRQGAQVTIRIAQTAALSEHRRFRPAQLLDKGKPFRHKVYGRWAQGVKDQAPYPFFRTTIIDRAVSLRPAMGLVLVEAAKETLPNVR